MLILGHRGAAGYEPENTIASVRRALEMDLDYIEIDVQQTKDAQLVVFHDDLLDRVTNISGYIWDYSLDELRSLVLVEGRERIPTLEQVCETVRDAGGKLFVELKANGIEEAALPLVTDYFAPGDFILGSFHHEAILNAKAEVEEIETTALLAGAPLNAGRIVQDTGCDYLGLGLDNISPRVIEEAKAEGAGVLVWTVNDVRDLERVRELGADGVFSNFPDRMKAAL